MSSAVFVQQQRSGWRLLLQHRHPAIWGGDVERGANMLGLPGGNPKPGMDTDRVDTAWREACEEGVGTERSRFRSAVRQVVLLDDAQHAMIIVDATNLPMQIRAPSAAGSELEVSLDVFPDGHVWVDEAQVDALLAQPEEIAAQPPVQSMRGLRVWPLVLQSLRRVRPALGYSQPVLLYHGTSAERAASICAAGFRVSRDGMMGPGVYLAQADKASSNAGRAAGAAAAAAGVSDASAVVSGVVLECAVDLGHCRVQPHWVKCSCGCARSGGVDHKGVWKAHFDSVYLKGGGPAAKRCEWCVASPRRVRVVRRRVVHWSLDRRLLSEEPWVVVTS
jgi:hypothetical protein